MVWCEPHDGRSMMRHSQCICLRSATVLCGLADENAGVLGSTLTFTSEAPFVPSGQRRFVNSGANSLFVQACTAGQPALLNHAVQIGGCAFQQTNKSTFYTPSES